MNQKVIDDLKWKSKRVIRILEMLQSGDTTQQIVEKLGVNRTLVDYYREVIKDDIT